MGQHVTLLTPYYCQPLMLERQIEEWWMYDRAYGSRLTILIIDDGSPRKAAHYVVSQKKVLPDFLDVRLYEVKENIPWNTPGVFNLGFEEAPDGWVFLNGLDHLLTAEELTRMMEAIDSGALDSGKAYRPLRRKMQAGGHTVEYHPPYGVLLMQRSAFWKAGGYDEDFSGWYGKSSHLFQRSLRRQTPIENTDKFMVHYYPSSVIEDAAVKDWGRKGSNRHVVLNEALMDKIKKIKREGYNPKNYFRFTWNRVF